MANAPRLSRRRYLHRGGGVIAVALGGGTGSNAAQPPRENPIGSPDLGPQHGRVKSAIERYHDAFATDGVPESVLASRILDIPTDAVHDVLDDLKRAGHVYEVWTGRLRVVPAATSDVET